MKKSTLFVFFFALALIIVGMFQVKYKVQSLKKDLLEINRQLASNYEETHILKAEWAYLNDPERIKKLADIYLDMGYTKVAQLKDNSEIKVVYRLDDGKQYASGASVSPTLRPILSSY